jgi:hypothetical protein
MAARLLEVESAFFERRNDALARLANDGIDVAELRAAVEAVHVYRERERLLDVDLSQRYILVQALLCELAKHIGASQAEAFVRSQVRAPFVRTLGPLEPIFKAMLANEQAGQAALLAPAPTDEQVTKLNQAAELLRFLNTGAT